MKSRIRVYLTSALILIFIESNFAQAPDWAWAKSGGNTSNDYSNATCSDANGNVYITGTFQGSTITFGSYTLHNVATGSLDIFIVKYDASGNVLWAKSAGGTNNDYAYGICADVRGNVYITGYFSSASITFGIITLNNLDTIGNNTDIFMTKYDSTGNVLLANSAGSKGKASISYGICTDADSNVYITGMFGYGTSSTIIFGNDTLRNRGSYDIFVAKYDAIGNILWAKGMGGFEQDGGYGICTDASNNVYVTGYFQNSAIFGNDTIVGHGNVDIFVAKYDTYGNKLWAKSTIGIGSDWNFGTGITANAIGNVYITGFFQNSVSFGNDTLSNSGTWSIFTAKYDSGGNALWGRTPGGTGNDFGTSISADTSGNVFVTGHFESSFLNFGGFPVLNANVGYDDIYVAGYDSSGNALWAKSVGGSDYDYGMGICTSPSGDIYVTGYFGSYSLNFGSTTITNTGSYDIFLAKLSSLVGINEPFLNKDYISPILYPNPTTNTFSIKNLLANETLLLQIINPLGQIVYSEMLFGRTEYVINENLSSGIYFVSINDGEKSIVKKLIVE